MQWTIGPARRLTNVSSSMAEIIFPRCLLAGHSSRNRRGLRYFSLFPSPRRWSSM